MVDSTKQVVKKLFATLQGYFSKQEQEEIEQALFFARDAHEGQYRKRGEPYIDHPIAVAAALADMHLDKETIIAGLLHDVPEDTDKTREDIATTFGEEVATLVDGVTKLGKVRLRSKEERQAENIRKMMLAVAEDVRVVLIKLADRFHNMQTIDALPEHKQQGIATETLEIYAPLAHRLGIHHIKWQLEDLSFRVLDFEAYKEIEQVLTEKRAARENYVADISGRLRKQLEQEGISAEVTGRPKHLYGIYRNVYLEKKDISIASLLDNYGIRVLVETIPMCYRTLGVIHALWKPLAGRLKDFIAVPKSNGYQSLHTGVICDQGKVVEVQIRTYDMHYTAEYGLAAHWKYKAGQSVSPSETDERLAWIRQLLEWQKDISDAKGFVEDLKLELFQDEIFVFTPKGEVRNLPQGATPIDFAYAVHTDLGHSCIGARVNGRIVPLSHELTSGDIIEILSSKTPRGPSRNWLEFAKTSSTRNKIRRWFRKVERDENSKSGKELLERDIKRLTGMGLAKVPKERVDQVLEKYKASTWEELFIMVGNGSIAPRQVVDQLIDKTMDAFISSGKSKKKKIPTQQQRSQSGVIVEGMEGVLTRFDPYCNPTPGDPIVGFITRGKGVTIHKEDCSNVTNIAEHDRDRVVRARWKQSTISYYPVTIELSVHDRVGLMRDIVTLISNRNINIYQFTHKRIDDRDAVLRMTLEISTTDELRSILHDIERVPQVVEIKRK